MLPFLVYFIILLGSVWNLESTRERNTKENHFLIIGFTMENIKENKI